jgi:hypothetical protein
MDPITIRVTDDITLDAGMVEETIDVLRLQEAGGWASPATPRLYVEEAQIANEGMA